jgi:hypothetical protein
MQEAGCLSGEWWTHVYAHNKKLLVACLVGWSFAVKIFWALRDNIINMCVITVSMIIMLPEFGPYVLCQNVGGLMIDCCSGILDLMGLYL